MSIDCKMIRFTRQMGTITNRLVENQVLAGKVCPQYAHIHVLLRATQLQDVLLSVHVQHTVWVDTPPKPWEREIHDEEDR